MFPFYKQLDTTDCGPTCLKMIAKYYGKEYSLEYIRNKSYLSNQGVNLMGISDAAETIGFKTLAVKINLDILKKEVPLPCILHWNQNHFVVLYNIKKGKYHIADPGYGKFKLDEEKFLKSWQLRTASGICLLLEPTIEFYEQDDLETKPKTKGFSFLLNYIYPYKRYIIQLILSMILGSGFALVFPFLTQSLVDYGINNQDIGFVQMLLISQLFIFAGSIAIDLIRSWIMLHMNSRINISIISDFLLKLFKLPIKYFDAKQVGDIVQRISDHSRIQNFLTGSALSTLFSFLNFFIFVFVLGIYSMKILAIFMVFSALGVGWITIFLKKRKALDYNRFNNMSDTQNNLIELIHGMQEIKLNNCETIKRWEWERLQARMFKLSVKTLALGQSQKIGLSFFNQFKNILITYVSVTQVISGDLTLGMMMSISYIVGQLNSPIDQMLTFIQSAQDAKISLERLNEVHNIENEEKSNQSRNLSLLEVSKNGDMNFSSDEIFSEADSETGIIENINIAPNSIILKNVSFQYEGPSSPKVLNNVNLIIPAGKVTAVVGASGSGKTTLMKLLLKFYDPVEGDISINNTNLKNISAKWWRSKCGSVTQEGYIFNDTIENNIALTESDVESSSFENALSMSNIRDYIDKLPLGVKTKIGRGGNGVSSGQKQRLLIARAIYKKPEYLFFDEATNSLDANNERTIMDNFYSHLSGKTVLIIAHRLSTVKNADKIVVMHDGEIVEEGTHASLIAEKGKYYELVKNQLELEA